MNYLTPAKQALLSCEQALHSLVYQRDIDVPLHEALSIDKLIDSANAFRSPKDNYLDMVSLEEPQWKLDKRGKELTISFRLQAKGRSDNALVAKDIATIHSPKLRFTNLKTYRVEPTDKGNKKYAGMTPVYMLRDDKLDLDRWYVENEDKFDSPEALEAAKAQLYDLYYVEPLSKTTKIKVHCGCLDYQYTFAQANKAHGAHFGRNAKRSKSHDYPDMNPEQHAGFCTHILFALEMLSQYEAFWDKSLKPSGQRRSSRSHKAGSSTLGKWASFYGY
ncbi:hypothetical protein [Pseudoalteromonas umbrosa]|uniref:hypothetical protein n=1 Tax=Pseudoalteromonas umbrosa TaxID=3048489 RepID=UPI0024C32CEB|nr:hypothetical protein [Pseudoalteromonas sp. B95]MDK1290106.1 hypothetical protein [Pseudoalteromonas sp. B95]